MLEKMRLIIQGLLGLIGFCFTIFLMFIIWGFLNGFDWDVALFFKKMFMYVTPVVAVIAIAAYFLNKRQNS